MFISSRFYINYIYSDPPILHCDLKPANILLNDTCHVKISDFGISRYHFMSGKLYDKITPPEVRDHKKPHSIQSDIYMFGLCLICICTRDTSHNSYKCYLNDISGVTSVSI